jgi:gliding motility-associated lipoprotein GldD
MKHRHILFLSVLFSVLIGCGNEEEGTPKPIGYFRIETPDTVYQQLHADCPYSFEYNQQAVWEPVADKGYCWGDLYFKDIKARLQLTYKPIQSEEDLARFLEDSRGLAYKHAVKADGILERQFNYPEHDVHGILYAIAGDAATSTQFVATDSTQHFMRGVVYFYASPNADSLKPVNMFMQEEVVHLIQTLSWENSLP